MGEESESEWSPIAAATAAAGGAGSGPGGGGIRSGHRRGGRKKNLGDVWSGGDDGVWAPIPRVHGGGGGVAERRRLGGDCAYEWDPGLSGRWEGDMSPCRICQLVGPHVAECVNRAPGRSRVLLRVGPPVVDFRRPVDQCKRFGC